MPSGNLHEQQIRWLVEESGNAGDSASAYASNAAALWSARDYTEVT